MAKQSYQKKKSAPSKPNKDKEARILTGGKAIPDFSVGDTLVVQVRITEGTRTRLQAFEGVCIARSGSGINENFTVRKISYGEGVERVFPTYSPLVEDIEIKRKGRVRRSKFSNRGGLIQRSSGRVELKDLAGLPVRVRAFSGVEIAAAPLDEVQVFKGETRRGNVSMASGDEVRITGAAKKVPQDKLRDALIKSYGLKTVESLIHRPDVFKPALEAVQNAISTTLSENNDLILSEKPLQERLDTSQIYLGDWDELYPNDKLLTTNECAAVLGISQPTVLKRIKANRILALRRSKRGYRIPSAVISKGEVISALKYLLDSVPNISHNLVWDFLKSKIEHDGKFVLALDVLNEEDVPTLISALHAYLEGYAP